LAGKPCGLLTPALSSLGEERKKKATVRESTQNRAAIHKKLASVAAGCILSGR
jgi:hypothetical protein